MNNYEMTEIYLKQMVFNAQEFHKIEVIPLAERVTIMDNLRAQTGSLTTQNEQFMEVIKGFREASTQGQSPDPLQLMEQVNVIYPNLI